ncbi:MAG: carbohydrate-binding domain-containing protein [Lachnospiraceae bacterium]|nr:carbohydrate-binding domain-containing protein [Lachnospiraceae bacterium]
MKKKTVIALLLAMIIIVSACGKGGADSRKETDTGNQTVNDSDQTVELNEELFSKRDFETDYDESTSAVILLNGDSAQCDSGAVHIDGTTITIKDEGTYIVRGTLENGMLVVDAAKEDKTQIVLEGASIHSEIGAPLYIKQADKVFLTMAKESQNSLSNGGEFKQTDDNNVDAAVFSKEDLTLNGEGSLTVTSPGGHGILSKDELTVTGGSYVIQCASSGISGKDNVCVADGTFLITAGKDGIHAEHDEDESLGFVYLADGNYNISAQGDGISSSAGMTIEDGTYTIVTGGGSGNAEKKTSSDWGNFMGGGRPGMDGKRPDGSFPSRNDLTQTDDIADSAEDSTSIKGIKATLEIVINGGTFSIDSADDGVHSNADITVNNGSFDIATGDDGFHADDTLTVAGGTIGITESYEGLEGLHVLVSGGSIDLVASDDGFNAAGGTDASGMGGFRGDDNFGGRGGMGGPGAMGGSSDGTIVISGGTVRINASGDGIDANGSLTISGGTTFVSGPFSGDTATLDYDTSAVITGGTFIGTGAAGMAQTFSGSEQGVIAVNAGSHEAGTKITLEDKDGNVIMTHEAKLSFAVVILSSPDIISGESYKITVGDASGEFAAN